MLKLLASTEGSLDVLGTFRLVGTNNGQFLELRRAHSVLESGIKGVTWRVIAGRVCGVWRHCPDGGLSIMGHKAGKGEDVVVAEIL